MQERREGKMKQEREKEKVKTGRKEKIQTLKIVVNSRTGSHGSNKTTEGLLFSGWAFM